MEGGVVMRTLDHYDRAMRECAADIPRWRALNRVAAELREGAIVYQPYAAANKALVKAAYNTLQEENNYADFGAILSCVRGEYL
jgi:hypothetical protein